jgi:hypothetical protein
LKAGIYAKSWSMKTRCATEKSFIQSQIQKVGCMNKKKRAHCGYSFKPKDENETICELCKIQLRDDSASSGSKYEFDVKCHGLYSFEVKGKLLLSREKVVFEPNEVYFKDKKVEIEMSRIKDVRFTTEKEISGLRVWLLGPTLATLLKKKHVMLTIDYDDETGITQHLIFEGPDMDTALEEINEMRRNYLKTEVGKDARS